jgi:apolipoprotein N-acyltransferase
VVASLAFPPAGLWVLAWLALAPWLATVRSGSCARAAARGAVVTASLVLGMASWLPQVVLESFGGTLSGAVGLWLLAGAAAAPGGAVLGVALRGVAFERSLFPLWAGSAWAVYELSLARLFPQISWLVLGATQIDTPVAPAAAVLGVHGVSALVVAVNALLAQAVRGVPRRRSAVALVLVLVPAAGSVLGGRAVLDRLPGERTLRVALVQPSTPLRARESAALREEKLETLLALTESLGGVDLVLWPESALSFSPSDRPEALARIQAVVDEKGAPLLLGAPEQSADRRWIAVHRIRPGQGSDRVYEKRRLVPFAETVPAWVPGALRRSLGRITPSWPIQPGGRSSALEVGRARLELSICFEAAWSGIDDPGATLLVNLVNDGWYDGTPAARQHLLLTRWRAIERGAWLVRAAYSGTSAFVSPHGMIAGELPVGVRGTLSRRVPRLAVATPFERVGYAWVALLAGAMALGSAVERSLVSRRARRVSL